MQGNPVLKFILICETLCHLGYFIRSVIMELLKMRVFRTYIFFTLFVLPVFTPVQAQDPIGWLRLGQEALNRGNVEEALGLWLEARDSLEVPFASIGFEFIRTVARDKQSSFYGEATEMYEWAISSPPDSLNRPYLRQEIERLRPLTGDGIYRQWREWLNQSDIQLSVDMKGYWIQMDPLPLTDENERLIEHWIRITEAIARFNKNSSTVYGTDDRAIPYVRYGEPDRKQTGRLTFQFERIAEWLQRQIDVASRTDPDRGGFIEASLDDTRDSVDIQNMIQPFQRNPEYEVWIYDRIPTREGEPLLFIFGEDFGTGKFRLHESIDDLIPERAFYAGRDDVLEIDFVREGLSPAFMLQMIYYEQLAPVDSYFQNRLVNMKDLLIEQNYSPIEEIGLKAREDSRRELNEREISAPRIMSDASNNFNNIQVSIYQYRFLDTEDAPYVITFLESNPFEPKGKNSAYSQKNEQLNPDKLHITHSLILYNKNWETLSRYSDTPDLQDSFLRSFYRITHRDRKRLIGSAMLVKEDTVSVEVPVFPFPPGIQGFGKKQAMQPKPLTGEAQQFEVSDLVLGYKNVPGREPFPFIVANNQTIPQDENLFLHFEVYHLKRKPGGFTEFELTYRIFPVDKKGNVITDQQEFTLTLNFGSEDIRVSENLEIQTAQLPPGLYELQTVFSDVVSRDEIRRRLRFEVAK